MEMAVTTYRLAQALVFPRDKLKLTSIASKNFFFIKRVSAPFVVFSFEMYCITKAKKAFIDILKTKLFNFTFLLLVNEFIQTNEYIKDKGSTIYNFKLFFWLRKSFFSIYVFSNANIFIEGFLYT